MSLREESRGRNRDFFFFFKRDELRKEKEICDIALRRRQGVSR